MGLALFLGAGWLDWLVELVVRFRVLMLMLKLMPKLTLAQALYQIWY
jgi:hypothetical protein